MTATASPVEHDCAEVLRQLAAGAGLAIEVLTEAPPAGACDVYRPGALQCPHGDLFWVRSVDAAAGSARAA